MKDKFDTILPSHKVIQSNSKDIYVIDYKHHNLGKVELLENLPGDIKFVYIDNNPQELEIFFDGFEDNALEIEVGLYSSQCECVLFPAAGNENDWILFIETKYTNDLKSAFTKEYDYPNCMVNQIIATVKYFRDKGIIGLKRRVNAIVSFPNLIEEFNSTFFSGGLDTLDILKSHNILIRATNSALVRSPKRIVLNSI